MSLSLHHIQGTTVTLPHHIKFYSEDKFVFTLNKTIVVQSLTNPQDQTILRGNSATLTYLDPYKNLLLTSESGFDSDVVLWDVEESRVIQRFSEHDGGVVSASISADGLFYATCGINGQIYIVELESGDIVTMGSTEPLIRLVFGDRIRDTRGRKLAMWHMIGITQQGTIQHIVFEPKTAKLHVETVNTGNVRKQIVDACFALNDSSLVIAVCTSGDILIIDFNTEEVVTSVTIPGQLGQLNAISCLTRQNSQEPAPKSIYSTYERAENLDEIIAIGGNEFVAVLKGQGTSWDISYVSRVDGNVVSVDGLNGQILAATCQGKVLQFVPFENEYKIIPISDSNSKPATSISFLDNSIVAISSEDQRVRIVDLVDFLPAMTIQTELRCNYQSNVFPTCLAINDIQLIVGFNNGDIQIFDVENGDFLLQINAADRKNVISIDAKEHFILVGGENGDVRLWDIRSQKIVEGSRQHTLKVNKVFLSHQGGRMGLISFSDDRYGIASVNGQRVSEFLCEGVVNDCVIISDGYVVASNRVIGLVDLSQKKQLQRIEFDVKVLSLTSDGQSRVFAGFEDGTIRTYEITKAGVHLIQEIPDAHSGRVMKVGFGGSELITCDDNGEVMFWSVQ
ncbi:WD40 repeat protein [Spironucleus salmonicida]|uniref:WD40 repeat protein n=1 Tax=Spironucleus salmonicida TaxID=348837 RepID=V6LQS5_9EUKA|nr:WD40 repeat protein [Spironucleus salmonicida]|eukprot:EST46056.1 hypothetical protein SS50377_14046 [Spironucleus salmonicida]